MTTLTERLRYGANCPVSQPSDGIAQEMRSAADEIDRLTAENAELRDERDALAAANISMFDLHYELAGVLADVKHNGFDNVCLSTIQRVHDSLLPDKNARSILAARDAGIRAEERERCAKECENLTEEQAEHFGDLADCCAIAIRGMADAIEKEAGNG